MIYSGTNLITGETIQGELFKHGEQRFICYANRVAEVIPETVKATGKCQYSGDECGYPDIACGRCSESGMEENDA